MYSFSQIHADFSATPTAGCTPITVNFTDKSTGGASAWQWDLGNGTTSTLQNPSVTYFNPGTYTVKLTASGGSGSNTVSKTNFITVYANPTAAFNVSTLTGCYPLSVSFFDQSNAGSGSVASWQWDFGDGNISTDQAPTHIYENTGLFNVTLTVKNSNGCSKTITKPNLINISEGVHANFTNTSPNGCALPATINFTNQSSGNNITSYLWNFGDGQTSNLANPTHVYTAAGVYTVTLTATNANGCSDVNIKQNQIYIGTAKADFSMPANVCTGNAFGISNNSLPAVGLQSSKWEFSDGTTDTLTNPQKTFTTPGTYTVKVTVDYSGGCTDNITKTINVLEGPTISFTSNVAQACKPPFVVTFTNTTVGGTVVLWDFGDGITSKLANPTHTYNKLGSFTVKLTAANANGCISTLSIPSFINVGPSKIVRLNNVPMKGCIPYTANFSALLYPVLPGTTYQWNFGDGTTSTQETPSHLYTKEGSYNVKLVITTAGGCTDTLLVPAAVMVGIKPQAAFAAEPLKVCPNDPVTFTDLSTGGADNFFWFFGDGGTSPSENPTYLYQDTGYKTVTFIATRSGCSDTTSIKNYVYIRPPIARFSDSVVCTNQFQHFFTDHSIVDTDYAPITYIWQFGDGDSSSLHSPTHLYADTGHYQVTLFVSDSACHHQSGRPIYILDEHAGFTDADSIGCGSLTKLFAATSHQQYIASYLWNFGDGQTWFDTIPTTSHAYNAIGGYNVALKIVDLNNCPDSITKPITVTEYGPTANFGIPKSMCVNSLVTFIDSSKSDPINKIVKWTWDFGDSSAIQTFTKPPFTHTYKKRGLFDITLTVTDSTGCTDTRFIAGTIGVNGPTASFYAQDTVQCLNTSLQFQNTSSGYIVACLWDFGDGTTDGGFSPSHTFTGFGNYTIKLTVTDSSGCTDTTSRPNYLHISNAKAMFSMSDSFTHCPPLLVKFTNSSTNLASASWDFGDGNTSTLLNPSHTYTISGIFNPTLLVTGNGGCTDSLSKIVTIQGPSGEITYGPALGCTPLTVSFSTKATNTDFYTWDFDDGSTSYGTNGTASHTYVLSGSYLPKIILADSAGCKIPIYGDDSIYVKRLVPHIEDLQHYIICDSAVVFFIDSTVSNDTLKSFLWNFGDGQTSTLQNPTHNYAAVGNYVASYTVTTVSGCIGSDTLHIPIKVVPGPKTLIVGPDSVCITSQVQFAGQWLNQDTSTIHWKWDLGNGQTSNLQTPSLQTYPAAGLYHIISITTNGSGCADTAKHDVDILPLPIVDAGPHNVICLGNTDTLWALGAITYTWRQHPSLSCINCQNPLAKPSANQMYWVTGTDSHGCSSADSVLVRVKQPFPMGIGPGDTLCVGQTFRLLATGAELYIWSPTQFLNNPTVPNPIAKPDSSITYRVIGYDSLGCFEDTGYISLKVYPLPTVDIVETQITVTAGSNTQLHSSNSADVVHLHWSPPVGLSCVACENPIASPKENTTYTLTVTNEGGCTAQDKVDVMVLCGDGNVFIPNTFSPNNDGANDVFYPRGKGVYSIKGMRIFSRWGQLIFEKTNFQPNDINSGWDGTFQGKKLTPDVFVYIIDVICENNQLFTLKGNVTLLK